MYTEVLEGFPDFYKDKPTARDVTEPEALWKRAITLEVIHSRVRYLDISNSTRSIHKTRLKTDLWVL